jgi:hypothetical protein
LDRGFGKPEINVDFRMMFEKKLTEPIEGELIALKERMLALSAIAPPVIEHQENEANVVLDEGTEDEEK